MYWLLSLLNFIIKTLQVVYVSKAVHLYDIISESLIYEIRMKSY